MTDVFGKKLVRWSRLSEGDRAKIEPLPICFGTYAKCRDCEGYRTGSVYKKLPCLFVDRCKALPAWLAQNELTQKQVLTRRRVDGAHRLCERRPFLEDLDAFVFSKLLDSGAKRCKAAKSANRMNELIEKFKAGVSRRLAVPPVEDGIDAFKGDVWWSRIAHQLRLWKSLTEIGHEAQEVCCCGAYRTRVRADYLEVSVYTNRFLDFFSKRELSSLKFDQDHKVTFFERVDLRNVDIVAARVAQWVNRGCP